MLNVVMLNVIILNVVMLSVLAPLQESQAILKFVSKLSDSAYGDVNAMTHGYHMDHEEPQTPTHHVQMSFEDVIDGYPAQTPNTRSRRIIREIIV
jgi:hypothetical protein